MVKLLYIDLFCGAGGTTTGIEKARIHGRKCAKVIACVNHDPNAIASHAANHRGTVHFTEDIRTLDISPLKAIAEKSLQKNPGAKLILHASLECTNFSKAKGGQPRKADSRTLADHLIRYVEILDPDYIQIENVEEFMSWGKLDENGKPVSWHKGCDYVRWIKTICGYGYNMEWRLLNAADYGAYTCRKRYFALFAKKGLKIEFPTADYSKDGGKADNLFGISYKKWKPVREVLDLDDDGESILGRKKPLVENTLKRIYAGLVKFVDRGLAKGCFLSKQFSGHDASKNISVERPAGTLTCRDHHALITYYGNGQAVTVEAPSPTITTKDRLAKVTFIANEYSSGGQLSSLDNPSPAIHTSPKQKIVNCFMMNPQYRSAGGSVDKPCFTLMASMDKKPPYIIFTERGMGVEINEDDSPMTVTIKQFMAEHGIIDIKMRMLKIEELKAIMGFPTDYILVGNQTEQKKYIGNAVEVNMSRRLCEALAAANM